MTNSEYFEKNQISFAKAMEIFNRQKVNGIRSFDKFLISEYAKPKFKAGDIVVLQRDRVAAGWGNAGWKHNAVLRIVKIDRPQYLVKFLTPDGSDYIGRVRDFNIEFINKYCIKY